MTTLRNSIRKRCRRDPERVRARAVELNSPASLVANCYSWSTSYPSESTGTMLRSLRGLRAVTLADKVTPHNAFPGRLFKS